MNMIIKNGKLVFADEIIAADIEVRGETIINIASCSVSNIYQSQIFLTVKFRFMKYK